MRAVRSKNGTQVGDFSLRERALQLVKESQLELRQPLAHTLVSCHNCLEFLVSAPLSFFEVAGSEDHIFLRPHRQLEEPTDLFRQRLHSRPSASSEDDRADGGAIVLGAKSESLAKVASDLLKLAAQRVLGLQAVLPWRVSRELELDVGLFLLQLDYPPGHESETGRLVELEDVGQDCARKRSACSREGEDGTTDCGGLREG
ncbi:hypothetical protein BJY59DRAFT_704967 [Rhodotorula toruloides]